MNLTDNDLSANNEFVLWINLAMKRGIENGADRTQMAMVCINTARELYDYYGAGDEYSTFHEFVVDTGFEMAEVEEWLDSVEIRPGRQGDG